jgi:hypothetical protein
MEPKSEAKKAGIKPPENPEEFDAFRKSLDPDMMGFDGKEVITDGNKD